MHAKFILPEASLEWEGVWVKLSFFTRAVHPSTLKTKQRPFLLWHRGPLFISSLSASLSKTLHHNIIHHVVLRSPRYPGPSLLILVVQNEVLVGRGDGEKKKHTHNTTEHQRRKKKQDKHLLSGTDNFHLFEDKLHFYCPQPTVTPSVERRSGQRMPRMGRKTKTKIGKKKTPRVTQTRGSKSGKSHPKWIRAVPGFYGRKAHGVGLGIAKKSSTRNRFFSVTLRTSSLRRWPRLVWKIDDRGRDSLGTMHRFQKREGVMETFQIQFNESPDFRRNEPPKVNKRKLGS